MTIDDALRTLGLTREELPTALRRAYLKLVKVHSPERDPEGFKRIREAYESLQGLAQVSLLEPTLPLPVPPAPADAELARLEVALAEELDPQRRLALAKAAVERDGSERAYWLWLDELLEGASEPAIADAVREALSKGYRAFLPTLRFSCPSVLTEAELRDWTAEVEQGGTANGLVLAHLWLERGAVAEAARVAEVTLHAYARPEGEGGALYVDRDTVARLVLAFVRRDDWERARAMMAALDEIDERVSGGDPVFVEATRELLSLQDRLDPEIAVAVADSLAERSNAETDSALYDLKIAKRRRWRAALRAFRESAPILDSLYRETSVDWSYGLRDLQRARPSAKPFVFAVIATMMAARLFLAFDMPQSCANRRDQITLNCEHDAAALCKSVEQWNKARSCTDSANARSYVEDTYRALAQRRATLEKERKALAEIRGKTTELCRAR